MPTKVVEKKVLLAPNDTVEVASLPLPCIVSPKLDGIRCLIKEGQLLSRSAKLIPNAQIQSLFPELTKDTRYVYDGELYIHNVPFQSITSNVMAHDRAPHRSLRFMAFDCMPLTEWMAEVKTRTFEERLAMLKRRFDVRKPKYAKIITHRTVRNSDKITEHFDKFLEMGYEGAMVRSASGLYKHGRATVKQATIFKLKSWRDYDGIILSVHEGKQLKEDASRGTDEHGRTKRSHRAEDYKPSGSFGYFTVQVHDESLPGDTTVEIGGWKGITNNLRDEIWANPNDWVSQWCTFQGMAVGVKDKPRIPKNFRLREPKE